MRTFEYARPTTLEQAVELLTDGTAPEGRGSLPLGGGTDLLSLMKDDVVAPGRLVDLTRVAGIAGIRPGAQGSLWIGARASVAELAADPEVGRRYPALAAAAARVGGPQIRAQGTVGGNLCQRPRCWYFRHGFGLLAERDGRSMPADGDNRYHAILGNGGAAKFVSPSTLAPLLVALGAVVKLQGPGGERTVALRDFYKTPARQEETEIDLAPGEILTAVIVPGAEGLSVASYEVRPGEAMDWSLATASVVLSLSGHMVESARVVLGQVAPVPWPATQAEQYLAGQKLTLETAEKAGELAVAGAAPLSMNGYKVRLARVAVKRALLRAAGVEA